MLAMDMNVKGVDEKLVWRAKAEALRLGQTLKDWVVEAITVKLGGSDGDGVDGVHLRTDADVGKSREGGAERFGKTVSGSLDAPGSPKQSRAVGRGAPKNSGGEGKGKAGGKKCQWCGGELVSWGLGKRCVGCKRNS